MELNKKRQGFLRTSVRNVDNENLTITHTINTKALDRYSTVVLPRGADVKHFLKNSVVLWAHNGDDATMQIPIAKCISLDIRDAEIEVVTEFNKNDALAVKIFNSYRDGFLHAWSIGFMPMSYKEVDEENLDDINSKYGLKITKEDICKAGYWGVYLIYEWELLEYSAVPVPGNPEALSADDEKTFKRELVTRGLMDEQGVNSMDIRASLKRDEEAPSEAAPAEEAPVAEESVEETPSEEVPVEETPAEEIPAEENPSEEAPTEEQEVPAEEIPAEEATNSTEDNPESDDNVAGDTETSGEEQDTDTERQALESKIDELNQMNKELSERLTNFETKLNEFSQINSVLDEIKKSLDVDNIEKVREAAQKRKVGQNPDTWFSNFLRVAK